MDTHLKEPEAITKEGPAFYSRAGLAAAAGIAMRTFTQHEEKNVGGLQKARETVPGLGIVYEAKKVKRYLAMVAAARTRKPKQKAMTEGRADG